MNAAAQSVPAPIKRLLLIAPAIRPESYGGAGRQAWILAQALARKGVWVTLAAPAVTDQAPAHETAGFGEVVRFRVAHYPNFGGRRGLSTLSWILQLRRWVRAQPAFDVVYVFHCRLHALAGVEVAKDLNKPLLIKLGGGGASSELPVVRRKPLYGKLALRRLLDQTDGFVANSEVIAGEMAQAGVDPARIFRFPNGVEMPAPEAVAEAEAARTGRRFVYTGRFVEDKNIAVLVEAAALAREGGRDIELVLAGDGPMLAELQARAAELGVTDHVVFTGRLDDVGPVLLGADFFISASIREGQSNALLEAMAAACAPVVCLASGVEEIVQDGETGYIAPGSDAASVAAAMRRAYDQGPAERARIGSAARAAMERRCGIDRVAQLTIEAAQAAAPTRARRRR